MKSTWTKILLSTSLVTLAACSGGGGGGGGGSSSESMLQARKITCGGKDCVGASVSSFLGSAAQLGSGDDGDVAVELYRAFNSNMIPAFNTIIAKIEKGVELSGAISCDDITDYDNEIVIPTMGLTAKAVSSSLAIPDGFTTKDTGNFSTVQKKLVAKYTANDTPLIEADVYCGGGTDTQPLTARVIAEESGKKLNAWFEKGSSVNHFRILMAAVSGSNNVAAWFKTDDGDTFELILGYDTVSYKVTGKKSLNRVRVVLPTLVPADTCLVASTLEPAASSSECSGIADPTAISHPSFDGLVTSGDFDNVRTLATPAYN